MTMTAPNKSTDVLRVGVVIVWAILASCTSEPLTTSELMVPSISVIPTPSVPKSRDVSRVQPSTAGLTGQHADTLAAPVAITRVAIFPKEPDIDPQQFLGLVGTAVTLKLGVPNLIRRDGTAEIWQYRATACILDVFLYASGDEQFVRHIELRRRSASNELYQRCFAELLKAEINRISG